ncbi:MAG: hypothetical protein ACI4GA_04265 [Acutalibacteraceae bacterium]|nr:hypothetical protein [Oscillospiraceae bacterium]
MKKNFFHAIKEKAPETYKTVKVNGKNVKLYSSWSKVKSIKTK